MNYRQIEIFRAVMESGSITRAAGMLLVTQPAVSKALRLLEQDIGFPLFLRTSQGLIPTQEARAFYVEADRTHTAMANLDRFARNLHRMAEGRLVVGAIPALSVHWLAPLVGEFTRANPDAALSFRSVSSVMMMQLVGQGELDIGLSQALSVDASVLRRRLFDLEALIVLPQDHPLTAKKAISASDLHGTRMVSLSAGDHLQRSLESRMKAAGLALGSRLDVAMGAMMCAVVEASGAIGLVDSETARAETHRAIVFRQLAPRIRIPIYLLQNARRAPDLLLRRFSEHIARRPPKRFP